MHIFGKVPRLSPQAIPWGARPVEVTWKQLQRPPGSYRRETHLFPHRQGDAKRIPTVPRCCRRRLGHRPVVLQRLLRYVAGSTPGLSVENLRIRSLPGWFRLRALGNAAPVAPWVAGADRSRPRRSKASIRTASSRVLPRLGRSSSSKIASSPLPNSISLGLEWTTSARLGEKFVMAAGDQREA